MFCVDARSYCLVFSVHLTGIRINGQLFKFVVGFVFPFFPLQHLSVIRNSSCCGFPDNDQQFDGGVHFINPFRYLLCDKVCWTFLNGYLMRIRKWHFFPVPLNALGVVLIVIKEVDFLRSFDHCWVEVQHFQQRPSSTLPHPNYYGLGNLLDQTVKSNLLLAGIALPELM